VLTVDTFRSGVLACVAALFLATAGPCVAGDAFDAARTAADQGDARAQYNLGFMYYFGEGVPQDHAEAVHWYRLAAEQGDARAQYNLGFMYDNGKGVPPPLANFARVDCKMRPKPLSGAHVAAEGLPVSESSGRLQRGIRMREASSPLDLRPTGRSPGSRGSRAADRCPSGRARACRSGA